MNPALQNIRTTTARSFTTFKDVTTTRSTTIAATTTIPTTTTSRDDDRRVNLRQKQESPRSFDRATDNRVDVDARKENLRKDSKKGKKDGSKKGSNRGKENDDVGLGRPDTTGCYHVCDTLIFEVYKLLGGSICDC